MRVAIDYGRQRLEVEIAEDRVARAERGSPAPPLANLAAAVRDALEAPHGFPPLRQALTPEDHVAVVVDLQLPHVMELLQPVLEHVISAGILPEAITLVCNAPGLPPSWQNQLPGLLRAVQAEIHDPTERKRLSYVATTKKGRRIYLNRTAADAQQLILLAAREYDPLLGYSGAEGILYPGLTDDETRLRLTGRLSLTAPGKARRVVRQEAQEVAWLTGAPFLIQIIRGSGDEVLHIIAGPIETAAEGERLLDARWRVAVAEPVPTVVAGIGGDLAALTFAAVARAAACAARVVEPGGRIILLTEGTPELGPGVELLRHVEDPDQGLALLKEHKPPDLAAAFQWARAAQCARLYLLSGLPGEIVEELFATPLEDAAQVQRLLAREGMCLFLPDAHRTLAVRAR